ncbi:MAG: hypothetical protein J7M38_12830 [Armatimonadetes bacterium]|nr:hypothetical protein [Armatimonadota bacterium]
MRKTMVLLLAAAVIITLLPELASAAEVSLQTQPIHTLQMSPLMRTQELRTILKQHKLPRQQQNEITGQFKQLPDDLQISILATLDSDFAKATNNDYLTMLRPEVSRLADILQLAFGIGNIWPEDGYAGQWSYAFGVGFGNDCQVYFDGSPVETYYLDWSDEFFPRSLAFHIPENTMRGVDHNVKVRNTADNRETSTVSYRVIAPRGYRGTWGWKFHNFSEPTIPWHLYANYFGQATVEYGDGTHRPAAQAWYDSAYKSAGSGGNCYGMSVSSLRFRNGNFSHMYWATWLNDPANHHFWLWDYNRVTETTETVQQMQGSWYTQEQLDAYCAADAAQDARGTYNRVAQLVADYVNRPVLVYWGPNWGHAVVPYAVRVNGDAHEMLLYDNNNPYRMNENGDPDPSVATVNWAANTFRCGTADEATAVSYEEVTPADPHLPGEEYGGPGSNTIVLVASAEAKVQQITDEDGRTLLGADGRRNEDPNTGIADASILYPLIQGPVLRGQLTTRAQLKLRPPADAPTVYVFRNARGKSLQVNITGRGDKQLSYFAPGMVMQVQATGQGQVQLSNILQARFTAEMSNPAALQPTNIRLIRSEPAGDRVFDLRDLRGLDENILRLTPIRGGERLEIQAGPEVQFNLRLQAPAGRGMRTGNFENIALQAGLKLQVGPQDWTRLRNTRLQLQFRNITNNQVINQILLPPK